MRVARLLLRIWLGLYSVKLDKIIWHNLRFVADAAKELCAHIIVHISASGWVERDVGVHYPWTGLEVNENRRLICMTNRVGVSNKENKARSSSLASWEYFFVVRSNEQMIWEIIWISEIRNRNTALTLLKPGVVALFGELRVSVLMLIVL